VALDLLPGEEQTVILTIDNAAPAIAYGLLVDPEVAFGDGNPDDVVVSEGIPAAEITNGDDAVDTTYNIPAATVAGTITYTVTLDEGIEPGEVVISFPVIRQGTFGE
ncbi:unnamed protein product, partial [marine sediment metagenome]